MKIINLIEDTCGSSGCKFEHGLSFYVETENHKLIVDTGASDAFISNAEKIGVDITSVDTVVISHGHYDHTGGLLAFAELNPKAKIYIRKNAFGEFYNLKNGKIKYIGVDPRIAELPNMIFLDGNMKIDCEISVFGGAVGRKLWPEGNTVLKKKIGDSFVGDEFGHEQYLVISEGERHVLLSGCAHNGILNILETYREIYGGEPTHVISGFHTVRDEYCESDDSLIEETARELLKTHALYYSGHCTGEYPMQRLKKLMGDRFIPLHSGDTIM